MEIKLQAQRDFSCATLVENIPLATGPFKKDGATIAVEGAETPADLSALPQAIRSKVELARAWAARFSLTDNTGRGLLVELDEPRDLQVCRSGRDGIHYDRVEVALPAQWQKDQQHTLRYRLVPIQVPADGPAPALAP